MKILLLSEFCTVHERIRLHTLKSAKCYSHYNTAMCFLSPWRMGKGLTAIYMILPPPPRRCWAAFTSQALSHVLLHLSQHSFREFRMHTRECLNILLSLCVHKPPQCTHTDNSIQGCLLGCDLYKLELPGACRLTLSIQYLYCHGVLCSAACLK